MISNIATVAIQVFILFVLIIVGFVCGKTKFLKDDGIKGMTDLLLYVISPCVIINSYQRDYDPGMLKGLFIGVVVTIVSILSTALLARLIIHDPDKKRENVFRFGAIFSNCGFMSIPLQNALIGKDGVFYGASYIVVFNILIWTYGLAMMSGGAHNITLRKIIFNPGVLGSLFGLFCFLLQIRLPEVLLKPVGYLADMNTALPMVIIGFHLANNKLQLKGLSTIVSLVLRLIITPLIMLGIFMIIGVKGPLMISMVIASSAPYAAITTMFSAKFGSGDTGLSAATVSLSTLLSILTMPVIVGIAMMM